MEMTPKPTTSRRRKFVSDLGVYAIGNLGSKLITFLLVPFYTYYITDPAQYGYFDVCLTVIFCSASLISLQLYDGGFRFLLDTNERQMADRRAIITFVIRTMLFNSAIYVALGMVLGLFVSIPFIILVLVYAVAQTFYDTSLQLVRGIRRTKLFVAASICNTFLVAVFAILFIAVFRMGVAGLFLSNILAKIGAIIFIDIRSELLRRYFRPSSLRKSVNRELLRYSIPMVPSVLCWWVLNSCGVFFIQHYCGLLDNGLYGVLNKFTGILYILANIFYQTWQQNAIEQYRSPDRDSFFSAVFNNYLFLLCFLVSVFPFGLRINYFWLVSAEYQPSSLYLFVNCICILIFAISAFFEIAYQCAKVTYRQMLPYAVGAVLSLTLNYLLVPRYGIYGAIFANIGTFAFLLIYRAVDTRRFMLISFSAANLPALGVMSAACVAFYYSPSSMWDVLILIIIFAAYIILAPKQFKRAILSRLSSHKV